MASFDVFPHNDPDQRLRFHRFVMAAVTSLMLVGLLGLCVIEGMLAPKPFAIAAAAVCAAIAAFYAAFRFGLNERAKDRSLTVPMMLTAVGVVTYVLYHVGPARAVFLLMYPVVLFFGVFKLNTRKLLLISAAMLCGYALVIGLLMHDTAGPEYPHIEMLQWAVLAAVVLWFSFMGGYVHDLRNRLRDAQYDELTGIYMRRRILEIFSHEIIRCDRGAGPLSVCLIDIDLFKEINDSFGHRAGDLVLEKFVQVAQAELRSIDFIGRHGGDEFLVILTQATLEGARECAERIRRQTEAAQPYISGVKRPMTVSIGAAQYRSGERLIDTLERADAALYKAKASGRNRVEAE